MHAPTVAPFATFDWLTGQGVNRDEARTVARALLLRTQYPWGHVNQQVPIVGGTLAEAPAPEHAIELVVTQQTVEVEGTPVFQLEQGKREPSTSIDTARKALSRALQQAAHPYDASTPLRLAWVVDARVPFGTIRELQPATATVGLREEWIVQSEPLRFGALDFGTAAFGVANLVQHRTTMLRINANGFVRSGHRFTRKVSGFDFPALAHAVDARLAQHEDHRESILIASEDDAPIGATLRAFHVLNGERCSTDASRCRFRSSLASGHAELPSPLPGAELIRAQQPGNWENGGMRGTGLPPAHPRGRK